MLGISVLGSGSAGNAVVVTAPGVRLLVDVGLSARQMEARLRAAGFDPDGFDAILLTHEHGDHVRGLDVFCRNRKIPVYCNRHTQRVVAENLKSPVPWRLVESGQTFQIQSLSVDAFSVPHDAVDPMGYMFAWREAKAGVLTDLGHATTLVIEKARGAHTLVLEANYDDVMLANDTKRPWPTKQRISARHGHLSNAQAAELVAALHPHGLRRVVFSHLSRDCNCPEAVVRALGAHADLEIICSSQDAATPHFVVPIPEVPGPCGIASVSDADNVADAPVAEVDAPANVAAAYAEATGDRIQESPPPAASGGIHQAKLVQAELFG